MKDDGHNIPVTSELADLIAGTESDVHTAQVAGELPQYSMFVHRLFKQMDGLPDTVLHSAVGMAGEGGEILDAIKKVWAYGKPLDVGNLLEELGDMRFYYQAMLNLLGVTDKEIIALNMRKLSARYPAGEYSDADAQLRADKTSDRKFFGQEAARQEAEGSTDKIGN